MRYRGCKRRCLDEFLRVRGLNIPKELAVRGKSLRARSAFLSMVKTEGGVLLINLREGLLLCLLRPLYSPSPH